MKRRLIKMLNAVRKRFIARRRRLVRRVSVTRGKLIIMRSSVEWRWQLTTVRRVWVIKRWSVAVIMTQRGVITARGREQMLTISILPTACLVTPKKRVCFFYKVFLIKQLIYIIILGSWLKHWQWPNNSGHLRSHVLPSLQPQEGVVRYCYWPFFVLNLKLCNCFDVWVVILWCWHSNN